MSTKDMPRVQKLKRNMSRAKSKDGVKDKSSSLICLIFAKDKLLFTVLSRHETIEGSLIGFTGTDFTQLFFTLYLHLNKMKHTGILINKRIKM